MNQLLSESAWSSLSIPPSQAHTDCETESTSQHCAGTSRRERITDGKLPQHCDDSNDTYQTPIRVREGFVLLHTKRLHRHRHLRYVCVCVCSTDYWAPRSKILGQSKPVFLRDLPPRVSSRHAFRTRICSCGINGQFSQS